MQYALIAYNLQLILAQMPPVGGGEHLPALLPDLRHFVRLLRYLAPAPGGDGVVKERGDERLGLRHGPVGRC